MPTAALGVYTVGALEPQSEGEAGGDRKTGSRGRPEAVKAQGRMSGGLGSP
jgi:hypothetical protein